MNTSAIILMLSVWVIVISFTIYFFIKILKKPPDTALDIEHGLEDHD
jgi:hypothetical protein